ncbi:hypothetical protein MRB53_037110 [Persea americana]|nr:hypothetical protein MRB53_037110 [Persea americana]
MEESRAGSLTLHGMQENRDSRCRHCQRQIDWSRRIYREIRCGFFRQGELFRSSTSLVSSINARYTQTPSSLCHPSCHAHLIIASLSQSNPCPPAILPRDCDLQWLRPTSCSVVARYLCHTRAVIASLPENPQKHRRPLMQNVRCLPWSIRESLSHETPPSRDAVQPGAEDGRRDRPLSRYQSPPFRKLVAASVEANVSKSSSSPRRGDGWKVCAEVALFRSNVRLLSKVEALLPTQILEDFQLAAVAAVVLCLLAHAGWQRDWRGTSGRFLEEGTWSDGRKMRLRHDLISERGRTLLISTDAAARI